MFQALFAQQQAVETEAELEARKANEGRVTAARVMLALGRSAKVGVS
jgi:hypothetical protein